MKDTIETIAIMIVTFVGVIVAVGVAAAIWPTV
jgi:hypothetical protein